MANAIQAIQCLILQLCLPSCVLILSDHVSYGVSKHKPRAKLTITLGMCCLIGRCSSLYVLPWVLLPKVTIDYNNNNIYKYGNAVKAQRSQKFRKWQHVFKLGMKKQTWLFPTPVIWPYPREGLYIARIHAKQPCLKLSVDHLLRLHVNHPLHYGVLAVCVIKSNIRCQVFFVLW